MSRRRPPVGDRWCVRLRPDHIAALNAERGPVGLPTHLRAILSRHVARGERSAAAIARRVDPDLFGRVISGPRPSIGPPVQLRLPADLRAELEEQAGNVALAEWVREILEAHTERVRRKERQPA